MKKYISDFRSPTIGDLNEIYGRNKNGKYRSMFAEFNASQYHEQLVFILRDDELMMKYFEATTPHYAKIVKSWYLNNVLKAMLYYLDYPQQFGNGLVYMLAG